MKIIEVLSILFTLVCYTFSDEVPLTSTCPSPEGGKIIAFYVTNCNRLPCRFERGKTYEVLLKFTLGRNTSQVTIKCRGDPAIVGQYQPIADFNACDGLGNNEKCPVVAGKTYSFGTNVTIPAVPPRTYTVFCEIVDDQNMNQICVNGQARIDIPFEFPKWPGGKPVGKHYRHFKL